MGVSTLWFSGRGLRLDAIDPIAGTPLLVSNGIDPESTIIFPCVEENVRVADKRLLTDTVYCYERGCLGI
jgi:hypothetical protein